MNRRIAAIQIQTIDACGARCVMCPHKSIPHTGKAIDDDLFARIVDQIAGQVDAGRIAEDAAVNLFFQNEPLLDPGLFQRARYVRQKLPRSRLICFTNGLLLPQRKEQMIDSEFDELCLSLYGYDVESFHRVTGLKISQDQYDEIRNAMDDITRTKHLETVTDCSWRHDKWGRMVLRDYSSRAGFYTGNILHRNTIRGCGRGRHRWLHFHADGEMVLCCMDWRKETVFGNVRQQSLGEILDSEVYRRTVGQVDGILDSAREFICKRCEWALPGGSAREPAATGDGVADEENVFSLRRCSGVTANVTWCANDAVDAGQKHGLAPEEKAVSGPAPMTGEGENTLVFTSASSKCEQLFLEWLVSLRTLGDYRSKVLVLDYGISDWVKVLALRLGVQLHRCKNPPREAAIVNYRFVDALPIIEQHYPQHKIAHFDADIWFTGEIRELFQELDEVPGCLYSVECRPRLGDSGRGPRDRQAVDYNVAKVAEVIKRCKGHINGGFLAGRYQPVVDKLTKMKEAYANGWQIDRWGVDQYLANVLFELGRDRADGYRWNCSVGETKEKSDGFYHRKLTNMSLQEGRWVYVEDIREEKVIGLHLNCSNKKDARFRQYHPNLFRRTISEAWKKALEGKETAGIPENDEASSCPTTPEEVI